MNAPSMLNQTVRIITKEILKDLQMPQVSFCTISENYTDGDLPVIIPGEEVDPDLNDMVLLAYTQDHPPVAGDIALFSRVEGTRVVLGKVVHVEDLPAGPTDAETWLGVGWVEPGDTQIIAHAGEISTALNDVFVDAKSFVLPFPGKYRMTCELANDSQANRMSARLAWSKEGNSITASTTVAATGSSAYPTFAPTTTVNMNINVGMFSIIKVQFKSNTGGNGYIKNISIKYQPTTTPPSLSAIAL